MHPGSALLGSPNVNAQTHAQSPPSTRLYTMFYVAGLQGNADVSKQWATTCWLRAADWFAKGSREMF